MTVGFFCYTHFNTSSSSPPNLRLTMASIAMMDQTNELLQKFHAAMAILGSADSIDAHRYDAILVIRATGAHYQRLGDEGNAAYFFQIAAEFGDPTAMCEWGWCLMKGSGIPKDKKRAIALYRASADLNNPGAQDFLGMFLLDINGEENCSEMQLQRNQEEAIIWFSRAVKQGYSNSQINLAYCYQHGLGIAKNKPESLRLLRLAAEQGTGMAWLYC